MLRQSLIALVLFAAPALAIPDFSVTTVAFPDRGQAGKDITVTATARYADKIPTLISTRIGFYLKPYSALGVNLRPPVFIGYCSVNFSSTVTQSSCSATLRLPAMASDTYQGYATADYTNSTVELLETNNTMNAPQTTRITAANLVAGSHFPEHAGFWTAPPRVGPGADVTLATTLVNAGDGYAGSFRLGFYLSTDATVTKSDILVGACTYVNGLSGWYDQSVSPPGAFCEIRYPIGKDGGTILPSLAPGTYYAGYFVDDLNQVTESKESDNVAPVIKTVVIEPVNALRGISFVAPQGNYSIGQDPIHTGDVLPVSVSAVNEGNLNPAPAYRVGIYAATYGVPLTYLGSCRMPVSTPGATASCSANVTVPALKDGNYSLYAVLDDLDELREVKMPSNVLDISGVVMERQFFIANAIAKRIHNIYAGQFWVAGSTSPSTLTRGVSYQLAVGFAASTAESNVEMRYYISTTPSLAGQFGSVGSCTISSLTGDGTYLGCHQNYTIPTSLAPGGYYFVAVADPANKIAETNETDNISVSALMTVK